MTRKILRSLVGHTSWIEALIELNDGQLASASHDKTVKVWNLSTGVESATLGGHKDGVLSIVQFSNGQIAAATSDYSLTVWDLGNRNISQVHQFDSFILSMAKLASGDVLLGFYSGLIRVWAVQERRVIANFVDSSKNGPVWSLVELDEGRIASGHDDGTVKVWELSGERLIGSFSAHEGGSVLSIIQLEKSRELVTSSNDKTIKFWSLN